MTNQTEASLNQLPRRSPLWLLALAAALNLGLVGFGWGEMLKVTQPHEQLYQTPDFNSPALGSVPQGETVRVLQKSGSWFEVEHQGKVGWLHQKAFPWSPPPAVSRSAGPRPSAPPGGSQPGWTPPPGGEVRPPRPVGPLSHPGLLQGKPVQGGRSDEIATGGKAVPPPQSGKSKKARPKRPTARKWQTLKPEKKLAPAQPRGLSGEGMP